MSILTVDDITTGAIDGDGVYDKLMQVNKLHLQEEYKSQRITGDMYAQAYIAMMQAAMQTATGFAVQAFTSNNQRDLTAEELERIKAQTAQIKAETLNVPKQGLLIDAQKEVSVAQKTLVTNQAATELKQALDITAATTLKGKQSTLIDKQVVTETEQAKLVTANTALSSSNKLNVEADTQVKGAQKLLVSKQEDMVDAQILTEKTQTTTPTAGIKKAEYENLTKQGLNVAANTELVNQKTKTEQAQILDTVGGATVTGTVGSQKKVHAAQAKAFRDESYIKAAKQHADAFAVILSNDEGATIPTAFGATQISTTVADMIAQVKKTT